MKRRILARQIATFCCSCTFPLPCICDACKDSHCLKPGSHCFLPLAAKKTIASERDLIKLQRKLHDLTLTHRELLSSLNACQRAREDVEAGYQEVIHVLTETRNRYLAQINQAIGEYEQLINAAMQDCYQNVWNDANFPMSYFTSMVWRHIPGEELNLGISCQVQVRTENVERLFGVQISKKTEAPYTFHPESGLELAKRNFTKTSVTNLLMKGARQLFPSASGDKRYIQLSVDCLRIASDARFLGFTNFNEPEWKSYLLPFFTEFKLKSCALYQLYLKPADVEIIEITEASLDGVVEEFNVDYSLVRVAGKGLLAVPGCYQAIVKLVRSTFIEVELHKSALRDGSRS